jgi:hypothetical protein
MNRGHVELDRGRIGSDRRKGAGATIANCVSQIECLHGKLRVPGDLERSVEIVSYSHLRARGEAPGSEDVCMRGDDSISLSVIGSVHGILPTGPHASSSGLQGKPIVG